MADTKISLLPAATLPVSGTERAAVVQGGQTVGVPLNKMNVMDTFTVSGSKEVGTPAPFDSMLVTADVNYGLTVSGLQLFTSRHGVNARGEIDVVDDGGILAKAVSGEMDLRVRMADPQYVEAYGGFFRVARNFKDGTDIGNTNIYAYGLAAVVQQDSENTSRIEEVSSVLALKKLENGTYGYAAAVNAQAQVGNATGRNVTVDTLVQTVGSTNYQVGLAGNTTTIGTFVQLDLPKPTYAGTVNITNRFGVRQLDDLATNVFAGAINANNGLAVTGALTVGGASVFSTASISSQSEAEAGTSNTVVMTPLRVAQAIAALAPGGGGSSPPYAISDITGLQTALDSKAAVSHTHVIGDVTGLQTALDGKAAVSHTHTIANVTGLQTALDGKYSSADLASQAEAEAGTSNTKLMTPLRTAEAIAALAGGGGSADGTPNSFVEVGGLSNYEISANNMIRRTGGFGDTLGFVVGEEAAPAMVVSCTLPSNVPAGGARMYIGLATVDESDAAADSSTFRAGFYLDNTGSRLWARANGTSNLAILQEPPVPGSRLTVMHTGSRYIWSINGIEVHNAPVQSADQGVPVRFKYLAQSPFASGDVASSSIGGFKVGYFPISASNLWGDIDGDGRPADSATANFPLTANSGCVVVANNLRMTVHNITADTYAYSEKLTGGVRARATVNEASGNQYIRLVRTSDSAVAEAQYQIGNNRILCVVPDGGSAQINGLTPAAGDTFGVIYDGAFYHFLYNGAIEASVAATDGDAEHEARYLIQYNNNAANEIFNLTGIETMPFAIDNTRSITGPSSINFPYTNSGVVKSGKTGARGAFQLVSANGSAVTSGVTWSLTVVSGAYAGAAPTISGTGAGQITFGSAALTPGRIRVTATLAGRKYVKEIDVTVTQDAYETANNGATVVTGNSNASSNSATWVEAYSGTVSTGAGVTSVSLKAINHLIEGDTPWTTGQNGTFQYIWQRETSVGSGTWTAVGSAVSNTVSPETFDEGGYPSSKMGLITNTQTDTGLTGSTEYSYRLMFRRSAGTIAASVAGSVQMSGA